MREEDQCVTLFLEAIGMIHKSHKVFILSFKINLTSIKLKKMLQKSAEISGFSSTGLKKHLVTLTIKQQIHFDTSCQRAPLDL